MKLVTKINDAKYVTHNGTMHADEVFATAFLDLYKKDIEVIRVSTVEKDKLQPDAIVYDIGRGKFDHHGQEVETRENGIKYSSFFGTAGFNSAGFRYFFTLTPWNRVVTARKKRIASQNPYKRRKNSENPPLAYRSLRIFRACRSEPATGRAFQSGNVFPVYFYRKSQYFFRCNANFFQHFFSLLKF